MGLFEGKKVVILGIANERSIAYGILECLKKEGAQIALTYMNEAIERRVRPIAQEFGIETVLPCDVQSDEQIDKLAASLGEQWGSLDGIVHSVAYAEKSDLGNRFSATTRQGFQLALDVSAYSLIAVTGRLRHLMKDGGSVLTLSYLGAERVVPNYNVMGVAKAALEASVRYLAADLGEFNIRVNAISAGPIKTLAASGIPNLRDMLNSFAQKAPLRRNTTIQDVGNAAVYFLSSLSSGVTGEVQYVDSGFNIMGM